MVPYWNKFQEEIIDTWSVRDWAQDPSNNIGKANMQKLHEEPCSVAQLFSGEELVLRNRSKMSRSFHHAAHKAKT